MLLRLLSRPRDLRILALAHISSNQSLHCFSPRALNTLVYNPNVRCDTSRFFSSGGKDGGDHSHKDQWSSSSWKISSGNDQSGDPFFGDDGGDLAGLADAHGDSGVQLGEDSIVGSNVNEAPWSKDSMTTGDVFSDIDKEFESKKTSAVGIEDEWKTAEGYKPWTFEEEEKEEIFDIGEGEAVVGFPSIEDEIAEKQKSEYDQKLDNEKEILTVQLKGPNRAFGDLIAASGITDEMLDSLILLKDLEGVEGLPPLSVIEDIRLEKNERKSTRAEIERKKQEEAAKARVRQVDEKGRAYGTGRRKCSVARVWIHPGDGKFIINDKQFDVYFPILDHRANLLQPFSETNTLGLWDVNCTVKGGGTSGQVGAVRLGISRALQNWEPGLRQYLRPAGFLTRDSRVVERKKPGKAKARKSFQWVKR
ncbi:hypothetical protein Syun_025298 [Stephania yunnanensis]|uniref:Ribosomal protein S9 n=1 Tax=Stephania yunnanensis TaxID=152371 RepID=A0AAP0EWZ6_9MAGN